MLEKLVSSYVQINNFGDKLNELLMDRILDGILDPSVRASVDDPRTGTRVFAIGSFLSHDLLRELNQNRRAVILGLGTGYAEFPIIRTLGLGRRFPAKVGNVLNLPLLRTTAPRAPGYSIYWVRGPLSAQLMGLPEALAVGDAGYMVRQCGLFQQYYTTDRAGIAFMPHFTAANATVGLREACEGVGIRYLDPGAPVAETLESIAGCRLLLTEALHGAIISDALRVPWIPLKSSEDIFEFKWRDFCASIGVEYNPAPLRVRWDIHYFTGRNPNNIARYALNRARSKVSQLLVSPGDTSYDLLLAMGRSPILSSDAAIARIDDGIGRRLEQFFEDHASGTVFC